ncbi:MAG: FixH family protein [Cyclobacteriaceae bacterium]
MKWNWGKGIALSFTVFCGLMIFMVIRSFQTDFHLVSDHYYQEELKYQDRIDEISRAKTDGSSVETAYDGKNVTFVLTTATPVKGEIHFYRPDNATFDYKVSFDQPKVEVSETKLVKGRYIVKVSWYESDRKYYQERELFIN